MNLPAMIKKENGLFYCLFPLLNKRDQLFRFLADNFHVSLVHCPRIPVDGEDVTFMEGTIVDECTGASPAR